MKIIHIIPNLWNGGAEKLTVDLCNELAKTENVILCSFNNIESGMGYIKDLSTKVKLVTLSKNKGFDFKFFIRFIKFLIKEKPDIINTHLTAFRYCFIPLFFLRKIKAFHTIHHLAQIEEPSKKFKIIKKIFFASKRIVPVAISDITAKSITQIYGNINFVTIYNGVFLYSKTTLFQQVQNEVDSYKINQDTLVFIIVANYSILKNYELIIKTFNRLYAEGENVILLSIGYDISLEQTEWNKIKNLKSENTIMLGQKSNVVDYLNCSNAFCLCSSSEGLPISILEAFSAGLPVLSTPAGGVPDIVEPFVNGLLTPDFSEEKYYEMIKLFLKMPASQIEKIKENNLKDFKQKFSIEITKENYLNNYKKVCS